MAEEAKPEKKVYKVSNTYEVTGDSIKKKNPECPKCGPGFRMAQHHNRKSCGRCGYTEFGG